MSLCLCMSKNTLCNIRPFLLVSSMCGAPKMFFVTLLFTDSERLAHGFRAHTQSMITWQFNRVTSFLCMGRDSAELTEGFSCTASSSTHLEKNNY